MTPNWTKTYQVVHNKYLISSIVTLIYFYFLHQPPTRNTYSAFFANSACKNHKEDFQIWCQSINYWPQIVKDDRLSFLWDFCRFKLSIICTHTHKKAAGPIAGENQSDSLGSLNHCCFMANICSLLTHNCLPFHFLWQSCLLISVVNLKNHQ